MSDDAIAHFSGARLSRLELRLLVTGEFRERLLGFHAASAIIGRAAFF